MRSFLAPFAACVAVAAAVALPAPQTSSGTLALGEQCSTSEECANGASCYSTNSGLIRRCGNFQATCARDDQCAYNTCEAGACSGFIAGAGTPPADDDGACAAPPVTVSLPLGAECNPAATPCANGASCYASNSGLLLRCGNFQAVCTSDAQCAYNTCVDGACSGFKETTAA